MNPSVLVLTPWVSRQGGGLQSAVRDLVRACAKKGRTQYSIMSLRDSDSDADLPAWHPHVPELHEFYGPDNFRFSPALLRASFRQQWHAIHLHGLWMFPSAVARAQHLLRKTPLIISPHGMLDPWILARNRPKKRAVELLWELGNWKQARVMRALNEPEAQAIRALLPNAHVAIVGNGVELPLLDNTPLPGAGLAGHGSPGPLTLLYLGRLHEKKGLHHLLSAWPKVLSSLTESSIRLRICGWGDADYERQLKAQAEQLNLLRSVEFAGPVFGDAKDRVLRQCDALILPSSSEGLPVAVLEAWSYAKPALITEACNLQIGFDRNCAHRIEQDPSALADSIVQFAQASQAEREAQGARARELVKEQFSWSHIANQMEELTHWSIGGGSRPSFVTSH